MADLGTHVGPIITPLTVKTDPATWTPRTRAAVAYGAAGMVPIYGTSVIGQLWPRSTR